MSEANEDAIQFLEGLKALMERHRASIYVDTSGYMELEVDGRFFVRIIGGTVPEIEDAIAAVEKS